MVERTDIWNDNQHTDNYKLFFEEIDESVPEKITLTTFDDDKNNPNNKWEFDIVDKVYIDTADQLLQSQIDVHETRITSLETRVTDIETEIENDYCKIVVQIDGYYGVPTSTGIYNLLNKVFVNKKDGTGFIIEFKGQTVIDDIDNMVFELYQFTTHSDIALSKFTVVDSSAKQCKIELLMTRDFFNDEFLSVNAGTTTFTKLNIGLERKTISRLQKNYMDALGTSTTLKTLDVDYVLGDSTISFNCIYNHAWWDNARSEFIINLSEIESGIQIPYPNLTSIAIATGLVFDIDKTNPVIRLSVNAFSPNVGELRIYVIPMLNDNTGFDWTFNSARIFNFNFTLPCIRG